MDGEKMPQSLITNTSLDKCYHKNHCWVVPVEIWKGLDTQITFVTFWITNKDPEAFPFHWTLKTEARATFTAHEWPEAKISSFPAGGLEAPF